MIWWWFWAFQFIRHLLVNPLVSRFPIGSTGKDPGISPKTAASAEEAAKRKALEAGEAPQKYQVVLLHMAISIQHDHDKH